MSAYNPIGNKPWSDRQYRRIRAKMLCARRRAKRKP